MQKYGNTYTTNNSELLLFSKTQTQQLLDPCLSSKIGKGWNRSTSVINYFQNVLKAQQRHSHGTKTSKTIDIALYPNLVKKHWIVRGLQTLIILETIFTGWAVIFSCLDTVLIATSSTSTNDGLEPNTSPNQAPPIIACPITDIKH